MGDRAFIISAFVDQFTVAAAAAAADTERPAKICPASKPLLSHVWFCSCFGKIGWHKGIKHRHKNLKKQAGIAGRREAVSLPWGYDENVTCNNGAFSTCDGRSLQNEQQAFRARPYEHTRVQTTKSTPACRAVSSTTTVVQALPAPETSVLLWYLQSKLRLSYPASTNRRFLTW